MTERPQGFTRDGHLTDLAIEYLLAGTPLPGTEAHVAECAICAQRVEAAAAVELPPLDALPPLRPPVVPAMPASVTEPPPVEAANRPWMWALLGAAVSAALVLLVVRLAPSTESTDTYRVKGNGLALQIFRDAGETSERLRDGDRIAPGDRLGFRLRNGSAGHLLVFGIDAANESYVCYPQSEGGASTPIDASPRPTQLPEAIRMDDSPGTERLIALLCEAPFALEDVEDDVRNGRPPAGCVFDDVTLEKP